MPIMHTFTRGLIDESETYDNLLSFLRNDRHDAFVFLRVKFHLVNVLGDAQQMRLRNQYTASSHLSHARQKKV